MSEPSHLLSILVRLAPLLAVTLAILLVAMMVVMIWRLWRRKQQADGADAHAGAQAPAGAADRKAGRGRSPADMARHFITRLEAMTGLRNRPYLVPWIAFVGSEGAGTSALIADLDEPAGDERLPDVGPGTGCSLHLRRHGVVVQTDEAIPGDAGWLRRWKDVVRLVRTHRPDRPLDGIVVAVPAAALLGERARMREALTALGEQFSQAIAAQQAMTGLRTPVWLLITGAEALPGFVPFVRALPESAHDGVLGWSSPYALDTAFAPAWVDEGIGAMASALSAVQLQVLMGERDGSDADRIFLFPAEVADLAHGLGPLLAAMLWTSAYHEAFLFRGFYVTGRLPAEAGEAAVTEPAVGRSVFLRALFDRRVFREYQLARPARGALTRRQRQIGWAKATLMGLGVIGAVAATHSAGTKERVASARQLVETMWTEVSRVGLALEARPESADAERLIASRNLIQAVGRVSVESLESWSAPLSLLTDADLRVEKAIAAAYDAVILGQIWRGLKQKLRGILVDARGVADATGDASFGAQGSLDNFGRQVKALGEVDRFVGMYQRLRETQNVEELASLVEYTFDVTLSSDFRRHYHFLKSLGKVRDFDVPRDELRQRTEPHLRDVMTKLYAAVFARSPLQTSSPGLAQATSENAVLAAVRDQRAKDQLSRIRDLLTRIDQELSSGGYEWLDRDNATLGAPLTERLAQLARLSFVTPEFVESLRMEGRRQMAVARASLLGLRAFGDRPIIVQQDGRPVLAGDLQSLKETIDRLFQQPFAASSQNVAASASRPAAGGRLSWDPKALRDALAGAQNHLASALESGTQLAGGRRLIRAAQQELLSDHVDALLAGAARSGAAETGSGWSIGDDGLRAEVLNFAAAAPLLASLRDSLDILGFTEAAGRVRTVVGAQAARLLRETDARLSGEAPYRPFDPAFAGWTGSGPLAESAFGASSVADLAVILALRREFVERLAQDYAQPPVEYLDAAARGRASDDALVAKWMLILRALQRYQMREPGNSIERLNQFILAGMDQLDLGNCLAETAAREQAGDYFGEQLVQLRQALTARCTALNRADVEARYGRLQAAYNAELAGRFPFVGIGSGSEPLAHRGQLADADPNEVRRFFQGFDGDLAALPARLRDPRLFAGAGHNAAAFLDQLARVRTALATMLADPAMDTPLSYELATEFRTNSEHDAGGNQIIQWSFTTGDRAGRPGDHPAIWTQGEPVAVSLRWARNAPQIPVAPERDLPAVEDMTATFGFTDPWALLSLVAVHTPPRAWVLSLPDRRPEVLAFAVPLDRNPQAAPGGQEVERAEVYMRLALTAVTRPPGQPERRVAVTVPFFPPAAPQIGEGGRLLGLRKGQNG